MHYHMIINCCLWYYIVLAFVNTKLLVLTTTCYVIHNKTVKLIALTNTSYVN